MATSPAPDAAAPPGMCPGIAVLGGGGGDGDGDGDGSGGKGGNGGGGKGNGKGGKGDGKGGGSCGAGGGADGKACPGEHGGKASGKGAKGDPVDVVTGEMFTVPAIDLSLPGPLPLVIERTYRSTAIARDAGLGFGWSHSLSWEIEVGRRRVDVWTDRGTKVEFDALAVGDGALGPSGWVLVRVGEGYVLDTADGRSLLFNEAVGKRFRLSSIRDGWHNQIVLEYERGLLARVIDSAGRVVRVRSTPEGQIAAWEIKNAVEQGLWVPFASYAHDAEGNLVRAADADGFATTYAYDDQHRVTSHTSPVGLTFHFRYDRQGRCVETWGNYGERADLSLAEAAPELLADGETRARGIYHCVFTFCADGYSEVVDSLTVHRYFGNAFGKIDKAVVGEGVFERKYDAAGNLVAFIDPLGATTTWKVDVRGRVLRSTDPLGRVTIIERDPDGQIRRVIDPAGGQTVVWRTPRGLAWTDAIGAAFEVRSDERGLTAETVGPNGGRTVYRHDARGNLVEKIDALGNAERWSYDEWGRCRSHRDGFGATTEYTYSARGDLLSVRRADGGVARYEYDGNQQRTLAVDQLGRVTRYRYGGYRKLCEIHEPDGAVTRLRYDREGRLVEVVNPRGEVHSIKLDVAGLVTQEKTFDDRVLRYAYDEVGRLVREEDGLGQVTEHEYDLAGQIKETRYDDGEVEALEYDLRGHVVRATSSAGVFEFERNALGWVTAERQTLGGDTVDVEIVRDLCGNIVRRRSSGGHTEEWLRDLRGNPQRVVLDGSHEIRAVHDAAGREIARLLPGGGKIEATYDAMDRLVERQVTTGARPVLRGGPGEPDWVGPIQQTSAIVRQAYAYSLASEPLTVSDGARGLRRYAYDENRQLSAVGVGLDDGWSERFSYDSTGNLQETAQPGAARVYGKGDRLIQRGAATNLWDDNARLIETSTPTDGGPDQRTRYTWDGRGMLSQVERADGTVVRFQYDPFARRVEKSTLRRTPDGELTLETATRFVWCGDAVIEEIARRASAEGDPVVEERSYCVDGKGAPFAHRDARTVHGQRTVSEWYYYLNDAIGTPEKLVGPDGNVACEIERNAWGKPRVSAGAETSTPLGFLGQYYDEETGLCYNRYRYYDPEAGRYISADPIGIWGGLNVFRYAENQPTGIVDPDGLMPKGGPVQSTVQGSGLPNDPSGASGHVPAKDDPNSDPAVGTAVQNAKETTGDPSGGNCAEVAALHDMASQIRAQGNADKSGSGPGGEMTRADVRREMQAKFKAGATLTTTHPNSKTKGGRMAPCEFCAQVLRELGLHPDNIGETEGGAVGPDGKLWDGSQTQQGPTRQPTKTAGTDPSSTPPFKGT